MVSLTLEDVLCCSCDGGSGTLSGDADDAEGSSGLAATLLRERRSGRGERRLLEQLVTLAEEYSEFLRQRLEAAQKQATTLRGALCDCRAELLQRRRRLNQLLVENTRLRGDNCLLRSLIMQCGSYSYIPGKDFQIKYMDTDL